MRWYLQSSTNAETHRIIDSDAAATVIDTSGSFFLRSQWNLSFTGCLIFRTDRTELWVKPGPHTHACPVYLGGLTQLTVPAKC
jgi:hypothetical protein